MLVVGHRHEAIGCMDYSHLPVHEHLSPESNQSCIYKFQNREMADQDPTKSEY